MRNLVPRDEFVDRVAPDAEQARDLLNIEHGIRNDRIVVVRRSQLVDRGACRPRARHARAFYCGAHDQQIPGMGKAGFNDSNTGDSFGDGGMAFLTGGDNAVPDAWCVACSGGPRPVSGRVERSRAARERGPYWVKAGKTVDLRKNRPTRARREIEITWRRRN